MTRIDTALQLLLGATQDQARAKATVDACRERLTRIAKERVLQDGAAPTWKSEQGTVRWDQPTGASTSIVKPEQLADRIAQTHPELVTATIQVPAAQLDQILQAIEFGGFQHEAASVSISDSAATTWLGTNATVIVSDATDSGYEVVEVDKDGNPVRTSTVPGVIAVRGTPRLVVSLNSDLKKRATAEGTAEADALFSESEAQPKESAPTAPTASDAGTSDLSLVKASIAAGNTPEAVLDSASKTQLAAMCRDAGLPRSGTKDELIKRLQRAING